MALSFKMEIHQQMENVCLDNDSPENVSPGNVSLEPDVTKKKKLTEWIGSKVRITRKCQELLNKYIVKKEWKAIAKAEMPWWESFSRDLLEQTKFNLKPELIFQEVKAMQTPVETAPAGPKEEFIEWFHSTLLPSEGITIINGDALKAEFVDFNNWMTLRPKDWWNFLVGLEHVGITKCERTGLDRYDSAVKEISKQIKQLTAYTVAKACEAADVRRPNIVDQTKPNGGEKIAHGFDIVVPYRCEMMKDLTEKCKDWKEKPEVKIDYDRVIEEPYDYELAVRIGMIPKIVTDEINGFSPLITHVIQNILTKILEIKDIDQTTFGRGIMRILARHVFEDEDVQPSPAKKVTPRNTKKRKKPVPQPVKPVNDDGSAAHSQSKGNHIFLLPDFIISQSKEVGGVWKEFPVASVEVKKEITLMGNPGYYVDIQQDVTAWIKKYHDKRSSQLGEELHSQLLQLALDTATSDEFKKGMEFSKACIPTDPNQDGVKYSPLCAAQAFIQAFKQAVLYGLRYFIVTCYTYTFICERVQKRRDNGELYDVLLISQPIPIEKKVREQWGYTGPTVFDYILHILSICKEDEIRRYVNVPKHQDVVNKFREEIKKKGKSGGQVSDGTRKRGGGGGGGGGGGAKDRNNGGKSGGSRSKQPRLDQNKETANTTKGYTHRAADDADSGYCSTMTGTRSKRPTHRAAHSTYGIASSTGSVFPSKRPRLPSNERPIFPSDQYIIYHDIELGRSRSRVVLASSIDGKKYFAIKIAPAGRQDLLEELQHEVYIYRKLQKLQGKGIPVMYASGFVEDNTNGDKGSFYIVFEKCKKLVSLNTEQAENLYHTLRSVHQQGILHGDVKMDNVLVSKNGTAYLNDFAFAHDDGSFSEYDYHFERMWLLIKMNEMMC